MNKEIVQNFDINATDKKQVRLDAKIYSQDIESAVFHLSFSDNGTELNLDDSYNVTVLSVFRDSGRKLLVDTPIVDGEAVFTFDNRLITNWDVVDSYVYLKKGNQTVDVNSFSFKVDVSKIDSVISDIKVYYIEDLEDLKAEYIKKMESINKDYQDLLDAYIDGLPSTEELKGKAGTIDVIGVEVLEENEEPKVINSGTESSAKLTFQLPRGNQGIQGERGEQGIQGVSGKDFSIAETFQSISAMSGDGLTKGDFVMISSTVDDPDNAKIYLWNGAEFTFITDMSGATGIKGERGVQGIQGERGEKGPQGVQGIQGERGEQGEQGPQGIQGVAGKDFSIAETFPSIASMSGAGLTAGDFVMISSTVDDPDNAKLYLWNGAEFTFITDMSGATGIKGDTGEQGIQGEQGVQGEQGKQGIQGIQGVQGVAGKDGTNGTDGTDAVINVVTQTEYDALPDKTGVYFIGG